MGNQGKKKTRKVDILFKKTKENIGKREIVTNKEKIKESKYTITNIYMGR